MHQILNSKNKKGPVVLVTKNIDYIFPSSFGYLAGYLNEKGEQVIILSKPENPADFNCFTKNIIALNPLLVGLGSLYPDLYDCQQIIDHLNEAGRNFPILIGGQMVSPIPEFAVEITGADVGVIGEGEITLYKVTQALRSGDPLDKINGLVINYGEEKKLTGPGDYIQDLANLPKIPYDIFPSTKWLNVGHLYINIPQPHNQYRDRTVTIHGGRGCPFRCNFCYHHSRPRYRPIEDMLEDAKLLIKKFKANLLYFDDDLAIISPDRAIKLAQGIARLPGRIEWAASARFDILDRINDDALREMASSGLRALNLGVESGSQRILDIIDKKISVELMLKGLKRLKNHNILPNACIMIGQWTESNEDVEKSLELMKEGLRINKNMNWAFSITTPYPGSLLYDKCLETKLLKSHLDFFNKVKDNGSFDSLTVNMTALKDNEVLKWYKQLKNEYKTERRKQIGEKVFQIEELRRRAQRFNLRLQEKYLDKFPKNIFGNGFNRLYNFFYDLMQAGFEKYRLILLGVKRNGK